MSVVTTHPSKGGEKQHVAVVPIGHVWCPPIRAGGATKMGNRERQINTREQNQNCARFIREMVKMGAGRTKRCSGKTDGVSIV